MVDSAKRQEILANDMKRVQEILDKADKMDVQLQKDSLKVQMEMLESGAMEFLLHLNVDNVFVKDFKVFTSNKENLKNVVPESIKVFDLGKDGDHDCMLQIATPPAHTPTVQPKRVQATTLYLQDKDDSHIWL